MSHPQQSIRRQRGVSAVEAMIAVAIIGILAGATMPDLEPLRERAELLGLAAQIETDVNLARSEAVARNRTVRLTVRESAGATCYLLHEGAAPGCSCADVAAGHCAAPGLIRAVGLPADGRVQVRANAGMLTFDPLKGTVTPTATLRAEGRSGAALHQVVSLLGRVRTCAPGGGTALGAPAC
ncbi:MAG: GspH/FimT family pseudopilin [Burkholderiaceae bacterium]